MPPKDSKATNRQLKGLAHCKRPTQSEIGFVSNGSEIPEVRRAQLLEPGRYLARNLPPMHKLEDIFNDLAGNSIKQGLVVVLNHLAGRPLRVATMCSGTESPLLALEMIQNGKSDVLSLVTGTRFDIFELTRQKAWPRFLVQAASVLNTFSAVRSFRSSKHTLNGTSTLPSSSVISGSLETKRRK